MANQWIDSIRNCVRPPGDRPYVAYRIRAASDVGLSHMTDDRPPEEKDRQRAIDYERGPDLECGVGSRFAGAIDALGGDLSPKGV